MIGNVEISDIVPVVPVPVTPVALPPTYTEVPVLFKTTVRNPAFLTIDDARNAPVTAGATRAVGPVAFTTMFLATTAN